MKRGECGIVALYWSVMAWWVAYLSSANYIRCLMMSYNQLIYGLQEVVNKLSTNVTYGEICSMSMFNVQCLNATGSEAWSAYMTSCQWQT